MNKAILITYIDDRYDYCKVKIAGEEYLFSRTGIGEVRTDVILTDKDVSDAVVVCYDTFEKEEIISICSVPVGPNVQYHEDGFKKNVLFGHASQILKKLGLFNFNDILAQPVDKMAAEEILSAFLGRNIVLNEKPNIENTLKAVMTALELKSGEHIFDDAEEYGIIKSIATGRTVWFGEQTSQLAAIGLYRELTYEKAPLCYDELVAIIYNLLLAKPAGIDILAKLVKEYEGFADKITATYERSLVYPYYEQFGFKVRKCVFYDVDGQAIPSFYLPGVNLNHTYINEYTTADDKNYVLCAAFDRHIRTSGRGIPILYRSTDDTTIMLHDRMNMRMYAMLVSKQNVVYFTADDKIFSYNINTGTKKIVFTEPNGCELQEIATITADGLYLLFFYGTRFNYYPNRGCILNTETCECKVILDTQWVDEHFSYHKNPFAGHFIINPVYPNLVNFLHGGMENVKDRMWLLDTNTEKIWQPYVQIMNEDGSFGEWLVHWIWSSNGKRLYFVRLMSQTTAVESGICYIDIDEHPTCVHVVDSEYAYAHTVPDEKDQFFISDTLYLGSDGYMSDIILLNSDNNKKDIMYKLNVLKNHPGHPHPQFSLSGRDILFTYTPEKRGYVCVGVVNVQNNKNRLE